MSYRKVTYLELLSHTRQLGIPVVAYENCKIGEQIGVGSSMNVHDGTCKIDGKIERCVAFKIPVKMISSNKPRNNSLILKDIFQDLRVMGGLNGHPLIVKLLAVSFNDLNPILVLELALCDMQKYLLENRDTVSWRTKLKFSYEIALALKYLHKSSIVHGDIKGANILIFKGKNQDDFEARLSDFGYCATDMSVRGGRMPGFTPTFQAPEYFDEELRLWKGKKTMDIYSYGLLVGQMARDGETLYIDDERFERKRTGEELGDLLKSLPRNTPEEFQDIIKATVKRDPESRASLDDIMNILQRSKLWDDELNRHCLAKVALASAARHFSENDLQNREHILPAELNKMSITPALKKKLFLEYKDAAENDHDAHAQFLLGFCFIIGFGVEKNHKEAFRCMWPVAKLGNRKAQSIVALLYAAGVGIGKDNVEIFEWLNKDAETGSSHAMYCLGLIYEKGIGVEKDYQKGFEWYTKASDAGDIDAANSLGYYWRDVQKNYAKAIENFTKAAEGGHVGAMYYLACILRDGVGDDKGYQDCRMAFRWFTQAADSGDPRSMCQLGVCYVQGIGIDEKDYPEGINWFNKAADAGDLDAMRYLGTCYAKGIATEKDDAIAIQWYTKAAKGGHMGAIRKLANIYEATKDYIKAIEWYTNLADTGDIDALCALGKCYEIQQNYSQAAKMYNKAADISNTNAKSHRRSFDHGAETYSNQPVHPGGNQVLEGMVALGNCYIKGFGVGKDYVKAIEYFTNAANSGYSKAMFYLGRIWLDGVGVERDNVKAIQWFERAVDAENSYAMCDLGFCYETGNGVPENNIKARMLYQESARLGNATAMYNIGNSYLLGLLGLPQDFGKAAEWLLKAQKSGDKDAEKALKERLAKEWREDATRNNKKST